MGTLQNRLGHGTESTQSTLCLLVVWKHMRAHSCLYMSRGRDCKDACSMLCVLVAYSMLCRVSIAQLRQWSRLDWKDFVKFALADYFKSCPNPILLSRSSSRLVAQAAPKKPRFGHWRLRDELFYTLGRISRKTAIGHECLPSHHNCVDASMAPFRVRNLFFWVVKRMCQAQQVRHSKYCCAS